MIESDIDIDFSDRAEVLKLIKHRVASIERDDGTMDRHNTGIYMQDIPFDPFTNRATIDHDKAHKLGYFKLDFLNVHFYKDIRDEQHLVELINREPMWELLEHKEIVEKLFHLNRYSNLCKDYKPTSVEDVAILLALIRPSKKHLQGKSREVIKNEIWQKPADGSYYFKKSHAISYAMIVVAQLNLLTEQPPD
jgi:DNA polymerase III alpha subunit